MCIHVPESKGNNASTKWGSEAMVLSQKEVAMNLCPLDVMTMCSLVC